MPTADPLTRHRRPWPSATNKRSGGLGDAGSAFEVDPDSCVVAGGDRNEQSVEWVESPPQGPWILTMEQTRRARAPATMDLHPDAGIGFDVLDVLGLVTLPANKPEAIAAAQASTDRRVAEQPGLPAGGLDDCPARHKPPKRQRLRVGEPLPCREPGLRHHPFGDGDSEIDPEQPSNGSEEPLHHQGERLQARFGGA